MMRERSATDHLAVLFGITLVLAGFVLTLAQLLGVRVLTAGWPLFVIVPGLVILVAAFSAPPGRGLTYLAIPGMIILVTGIILEFQALTGDWRSWSYAWALVAPGAVGAGLLIAGVRERSRGVRIAGTILLAAGIILFIAAEWFFVRIVGVGGPGLGWGFGLVFPALVVTAGVAIVAVALTRGR